MRSDQVGIYVESITPNSLAEVGGFSTGMVLLEVDGTPLAETDVLLTKCLGGQLEIIMRILVVEDDEVAAEYVRKGLMEAGHVVDLAADGDLGLEMAKAADYDALILDRMLPKLDGLDLLANLREDGDATPVLILSALGEVDHKVQPREFRLLECLMRNAGRVVTRTMLLEKVWDYHFDPQTNVIDVHISRLRGKIDKDFEQPLLHTVRGAGYRLQV